MNSLERMNFIREQLQMMRAGRVPEVALAPTGPEADVGAKHHKRIAKNGVCFELFDDPASRPQGPSPPPKLPRLKKGVLKNIQSSPPDAVVKSDVVVNRIKAMEAQRADRRRLAAESKSRRQDEVEAAAASGVHIDHIDFLRLLSKFRAANGLGGEQQPWALQANIWEVGNTDDDGDGDGNTKIRVCVRKRPMLRLEMERRDFDVVDLVPSQAPASSGPRALFVHEPRSQVNLTKAVDSHSFSFDAAFGQSDDNHRIYSVAVHPLVDHVARGGVASVFAYGQTGSGKTHTMFGRGVRADADDCGLMALAAHDMMRAADAANAVVLVAFYEVYGGQAYDLLSARKRCEVQEDAHGRIAVVGLTEMPVASVDALLETVERAQRLRVTGCTSANESSSRSHAIVSMSLRRRDSLGEAPGKLLMIDLAGSERASDSTSKDRKTRLEGAEINKSLLSLKECIRALDDGSGHVPFRGSKLTLVLRDSFVGQAKTLMLANVAPGAAAAEHTLNTLRYAQRVRDFSAKRLAQTPSHGPASKLNQIQPNKRPPAPRQRPPPLPRPPPRPPVACAGGLLTGQRAEGGDTSLGATKGYW
mmetsp:Transcript_33370/g.87872  ORF Transcript_33370/g.87872 Transcript_33370/m.87872 type:complete len:588 (-) Transcript_33370:216-1979(-)